jgi:hypothetical protein
LKDVWILAPFASKGRGARILCIRHAALEEGGVADDKNPGGRGALGRAYRMLMIRQIMAKCRVRYAVVKCVCEVD